MLTGVDGRTLTILARAIAPVDTSNMAVALLEPGHPLRPSAEHFVRKVFQAAYHARPGRLYPSLLSISQGSGQFAAIAGIRPAGGETLFSEYYLEQPVEQLLGTPRSGIAEIGNLAPASTGQARWLICAVSAFLIGAGFSHVVFTAVPKLRNAFRRMGLPLTELAKADILCLPPAQRAEWGSYYQHAPAVFAGDIDAGTGALLALIRSDSALQRLSDTAFQAGRSYAGCAVTVS